IYSTDGIVVNAESRTLVADLDVRTHRPSLPEDGGRPAFTNDRVFYVLETGSLLAFDKGSLARTDSVGLGDDDYFDDHIEALSIGDHALGFFNEEANLVLWRDDTVVPEN
ncbi:MAG: hypothetical protein HKN21_03410, partial [Candidatus Eisenbacteria bacterium]|nr:hypothetical protein [Candidatus Eisenbacteria bacterium]